MSAMGERRKQRKRHAGPPQEAKRLSLLDLPPAADPRDELPTNPAIAVRPEARTTLIPVAAEPLTDVSLTSLAQAARRTAGVPWTPTVMPAAAGRAVAAPSTEETVPVDIVWPSSQRQSSARPSSLPPPVQIPSQPPRRRSRRDGNPWLRTLGVIVLSSSVGALVASLISSARNDLGVLARRDRDIESARGAALAPTCAPATPVNEARAPGSAPSIAGKGAADAPRITLDALPLVHTRPATRVVEPVSGDGASSGRTSEDRKPRAAENRSTPDGQIAARSGGSPSGDFAVAPRRARPAPSPETLPEQPSRAALSQAIGRAAAAATSCDTGPQDGKVTVTFAPSGAVQSVTMVKGFGDAMVNACVLRAFGRARVPAFSGDPVQVRKSVAW